MGYASSADRSRRRARPAWLPLAAAAIVVPTVLAGLTLLWPRPQIEDGLSRAVSESLATAGIQGAQVVVSGRDATISGVSGAEGGRAVEIAQAVTGVRVAQVGAPAPDDGVDDRPAVDPNPSAGAAGELDAAAKQELQAAIDALVAGAPIIFGPDSPQLTAEGSVVVERVLELVTAAPAARLQVDGFVAAGPGNGQLTAQELSDQRAATVRDALLAAGVPADRLTARGLGEGDSPVAQAEGRRVEITVV